MAKREITQTVREKADKLNAMVKAIQREAENAVAFHEAWQPMAHDAALHSRMGTSFATNTFHVIRVGLWREWVGALMRIWDNRHDSIHLHWIIEQISDTEVITELRGGHLRYVEQQEGFGAQLLQTVTPFIQQHLLESILAKVPEAAAEFESYSRGSKRIDFDYLMRVRHEQLAHSLTRDRTLAPADWTDVNTADFYRKTLSLSQKLMSIVLGLHSDLAVDSANVHAFHARFFWESVRGERTEGHPSFRRELLS